MLATPPGSPVIQPALAPLPLGKQPAERPRVQEFDISAEDSPRSDEVGDLANPTNGTDAAVAARERRKLIVKTAQQWVHLKGLEVQAKVAMKRDSEEQQTNRCRIIEENRTKQVESMAKVTETHIEESHRTQRQREAHRAQAIREAIQVHGQIQTQKMKEEASMRNMFEWMVASLVGAVGATATQTTKKQQTKRRATLRRGQSLSQYVSALILVTFVRHLWKNAQARRLLLWSRRLGPYLRGILGQLLKSALQILQDPFHIADPDVKPSSDAERVEEALARLAAKRPLPAPEDAPECWESLIGPHGRRFWHNRALGVAPWKLDQMVRSEISIVGESLDRPLLAPEAAPELWESRIGPHGQVFWHNRSLGPVPWTSGGQTSKLETQVPRPRTGTVATAISNSSLRQLLANWGLNKYAAALDAAYYSADSLKNMDERQAEEMLKVISCTEEDGVIFRKALESWKQ